MKRLVHTDCNSVALGMLLPATVRAENTVDVKEIVFGHIGDSLRMAHHDVGRNSRYDSFAGNSGIALPPDGMPFYPQSGGERWKL